MPVKTIEEKEKEAAERLKALQEEEKERMVQPSSKNRAQTYYSVEELDERLIRSCFLKREKSSLSV